MTQIAVSNKTLAGAWKLLSATMSDSEGNVTHTFGEEAKGTIVYTEDGHVSVNVMAGGRAPFSATRPRGGTAAEKAGAFDDYLAYAGRYQIRGGQVVHRVEVSLFPNWSGTELVRHMEIQGDRLTLRSDPVEIAGAPKTIHAVWERV